MNNNFKEEEKKQKRSFGVGWAHGHNIVSIKRLRAAEGHDRLIPLFRGVIRQAEKRSGER